MPGPSATLYNRSTNTYEEVPSEKVSDALASGKYAGEGSTRTLSGGGEVVRPIEQLGAAGTQGEQLAEGSIAAAAAEQRHTERAEASSDKALSFAEGVGDALTLGLIHGTSEEAEFRREADSGSALLGQLVGTAIGLKLPGPVSWITKSGDKLGSGVARALLGEVESGFKGTVTRGLAEAGANAALMGASAFGHAVTDAVVANKPFAAESIITEAGIGSLMGFGFGFAGSAFGKLAKASRGAVEASGVATKEADAALSSVQDLTRTWDAVVESHAQRLGVLRVLAEEGHIPVGNLKEAEAALARADGARDALAKLDSARSLGGDAKEYAKWRQSVERYQTAIDDVTEKFAPSLEQRASVHPVEPGQPIHGPQRGLYDVDAAEQAGGKIYTAGQELDRAMAGARQGWTSELKGVPTEELHARYESIYGHPFEAGPMPEATVNPDEANLGGQHTPTSELGTNPGQRRKPFALPKAEAPATQAETGQDFVSGTKTLAEKATPGVPTDNVTTSVDVAAGEASGRAKTRMDATSVDALRDTGATSVDRPAGALKEVRPIDAGGRDAVKKYLDGWVKDYDARPRVTAQDQLTGRLTEALDNIAKAGGSRLDSVGSLELTKSLGLKEASSPLGQRLDQVWSLGQAGKFAADEARGLKTPLRKGILGMLQRTIVRKGAGAVLGGAFGGPAGAIMGYALSSAGFAGAVASSAGRLGQQVAKVGEALLKGRRATLVAKAAVGNRPYQYSDEGPIKDPVKRIQEIQRMAANPDAIKARVTKQVGDLVVTAPEIAQHLIEATVAHIQAIAASAPAIMVTPLGRNIQPSGTALDKFFDFENSMHDLPGTLDAMAAGRASDSQIRAFHIGFPAAHVALVKSIVGDVDSLQKLEDAKLRNIERILGTPLTRASAEPAYTARLQSNWAAPQPQPQGKAQAFKITAPKPTPVQSTSSGRAPGNERIAQ